MPSNISFVMMLDNSGSMREVMPLVRIDAKAFVRSSRKDDRFAVNKFSNNASWVYPAFAPPLVTVSDDKRETQAAADAIETITASGQTNMGAAFTLAQQALAPKSGECQAFVLLTDGDANAGTMPEDVYNGQVPLYIAALGRQISDSKLEKLKQKNPKNRIYHKYSALDMMLMFNEIRGDMSGALLLENNMKIYKGSDYHLSEIVVSEASAHVQLSVVWSDSRCRYTKDTPSGYAMNVVLADEQGTRVNREPDVQGEGFCIFNFTDMQPGTWRILVQYALPAGCEVSGTASGLLYSKRFSLIPKMPAANALGDPLMAGFSALCDGMPLPQTKMEILVSRPNAELQKMLSQNAAINESEDTPGRATDLFELHRKLRSGLAHERHTVAGESNDIVLSKPVGNLNTPGFHTREWRIQGVDPQTNHPVRFIKSQTIWVE